MCCIMKGGRFMYFFDDISCSENQLCGCDDHCGSDSWGCDS